MKNRNEMINGWIKEVNASLSEAERLPDPRQSEMRIKWLERLRADLNHLRDGLN